MARTAGSSGTRAEGEAGPAVRSSRPHHFPRRTSRELEDAVVRCGRTNGAVRTGSGPNRVSAAGSTGGRATRMGFDHVHSLVEDRF
jgi:hypothetical protein